MKQKRPISVNVINPPGQSIWFQNGKATDSPNFDHSCSTNRFVRTTSKARRIARGILTRWTKSKVRIQRYGDKYGELWSKR